MEENGAILLCLGVPVNEIKQWKQSKSTANHLSFSYVRVSFKALVGSVSVSYSDVLKEVRESSSFNYLSNL